MRFILDGYDALLHAPYDYYIIDYMTFHEWKFDFNTMKIPKGKELSPNHLFASEESTSIGMVVVGEKV